MYAQSHNHVEIVDYSVAVSEKAHAEVLRALQILSAT